MSSKTKFLEDYNAIKNGYKNAVDLMHKGLSHEEAGRKELALKNYQASLVEVEKTFAIPVGLPDAVADVEQEWKDACTFIQRLHSMKQKLQCRTNDLMTELTPIDHFVQDTTEIVPASSSTLVNEEEDNMKSYKKIVSGMRELLATKHAADQVHFDAVFHSQCKLYKILSNGIVITLSCDSPLSLVLCNTVDGKWKYLDGIYFIQCEVTDKSIENCHAWSWIYPLIPSITKCYRTEYGAFIFPDLETPTTAASFGIMFCDDDHLNTIEMDESTEDAAFMQQFFQDLLEAILSGSIQQLTTCEANHSFDKGLSKSIVNVADIIANNLVKGAEKTGDLMVKATPYIISKIQPAAAEQTEISPAVQTSVQVAQKVTNAAAGITGWVANKVGCASVAVGRYLAPHVQTQGTRLLEKRFGYDSNAANEKMEGAMAMAAGTLEGISTVYHGFEQSAKILGNNISTNSVKIIEHKYGQSAGNVAAGTFDTLGNAFVISQNVNYITPKGIAKKLVKKTGEALVDDYKQDLRRTNGDPVAAGMLYPDLRAVNNNSLL